MKTEYFMNVTKKCNSNEYVEKLTNDTLFIYSPTSLKKRMVNNNYILMKSWHDITKNIDLIDEFIKKNNTIKEVVSYGGGTIDIGKYISYKLNVKFSCIPTMLSTNSYATNKASLIKGKQKITIETKIPDTIIIDENLLKLSKKENIYGLADVFSIYTALNDWIIAKEDIDEVIDIKIYNMAENLLKNTINFVNNNNYEEIINNNMKLYELIGVSGYITNIYGTGRPESGSEHIMAKEIERNIDIPHGISVSIGILIMGIMQKRNINDILKVINKLKIFDSASEFGLNNEIIKKCFLNLKPRIDRYTIIDRYKKIENKKYIKIENYFNILK